MQESELCVKSIPSVMQESELCVKSIPSIMQESELCVKKVYHQSCRNPNSALCLYLFLCGLDDSLFKPREIRNWSKDDVLSYTAHRLGKTALNVSRTFLRQAFVFKKIFKLVYWTYTVQYILPVEGRPNIRLHWQLQEHSACHQTHLHLPPLPLPLPLSSTLIYSPSFTAPPTQRTEPLPPPPPPTWLSTN
jgi:hypothetical protein